MEIKIDKNKSANDDDNMFSWIIKNKLHFVILIGVMILIFIFLNWIFPL